MGGVMSSVTISGDTSGSIILQAPAVSGSTTLTLPTTSGTVLTTANTFGAGTGPAFSAYLGAEQVISSSTFTKVALSTELFDTNNNFDSTTNYRFTPTVAGYYQINAFARVIGVNASNKILAIYRNGSVLYSFDSFTPSTVSFNGSFTPMVMSATIYCNGSTDYIELYGYSNGTSTSFAGGGGGTNVAPWYTFMTGFLARSA
jgi:hypothetical protein